MFLGLMTFYELHVVYSVEWGQVTWKRSGCGDSEAMLWFFKVHAGFDFYRILTQCAISNDYVGLAPVRSTLGKLSWGTRGRGSR
jgi:hypothetical protein